MRRLDKMTKEEIIQLFICNCYDCPQHSTEDINLCSDQILEKTCEEIKQEWLYEEIQMKSRWELCHTDEDFIRLIDEANDFCNATNGVEYSCDECRLNTSCNGQCGYDGYIKAYGTEKVEVEE